jgi:hypothetical protein
MYRETQWTTDYPSVLEIVTTLFPSRMPYYISCPASALTTVLILRRNIHENRASEPQRDGVGEMTLPAPSVAHSQKKKLTKSPTTQDHNLKSRRNGVYFANSPLLPIQPSTEQLTTSPSVDEIDEEQTDIKSLFFVINIEKDQSVKFCHLSFDQVYGKDGEWGDVNGQDWGEAN